MKIEIIQNKIYEIRGEKVMLDFDIAHLYEVETRVFNQAVKRNIESFPKDFMFRLTTSEWLEISSSQIVMMEEENSNKNMPANSSQIVMSSRKHRGAKYLPYVFTEHGVTMAASVLKSPKARKMPARMNPFGREYCHCSGIYCFKKTGTFRFVSNKFSKRIAGKN